MPHTLRERQKLLNRVRRIAGQITAAEDLLEADAECERALHLLAACRGAISSLMAEILEDHIMSHVVDPDAAGNSPEREAAEQLLDIIKSYLR
ncbi:MAG TPA: metal/formaldehyde-sensitive transcriptional repressor [Gemmatimonadaceae bacterium]|jgi:DNA-binding FrmR family transcriptional regulator|nr:metal/formaldehyde-sensitive transcriptional repressor [Gemmatimonadaceae bacterium]